MNGKPSKALAAAWLCGSLALCLASREVSAATTITGEPIQGGLIFGRTAPGSEARLDGKSIMVSADGDFVLGFDRDETGQRVLKVSAPGQAEEVFTFDVKMREYQIERVDGLPPSTVKPDPVQEARIANEAAQVSAARARVDDRSDYLGGFMWPARGRISGVYGSQRILNGEPKRPHYGLDIAGPTGTPVYAPAAGIVTLAHPAMFLSGGTLVLDHGQGLSSTFLHLSELLVTSGTSVKQGDKIALMGATGRASGPHLDWRMNWLDRKVDPELLLEGKPAPLK